MQGRPAASGQQAAADQDNEASSINWSRVSAYLSQVATNAALDLPPLEEDLSFLRRCYVLATLCHMAYSYRESDVSSTSNIELPLAGALHDVVVVAARLIHFKEAELGEDLDSPQQYGIWEVDGLGLVIAFRGTASPEDVFIDVNITPVPLTSEQDESGAGIIKVHKGFYEGAKGHADIIVQVVRQQDARVSRPLQVWVTGHSLGGAYANALILHLLERRQTAQLFAAGGGSVTFGAPMVVFSEEPDALYRQLAEFEEHAEAQYAGSTHLQFHNLVNNADVVPRLLGRSLDTVHEAMEGYISSMQAVRGIARKYHPFGQYHFVIGASIRSLALPDSDASSRRMGNADYAQAVHSQLDVRRIWKSVYATSGKGAGVTHHSIMSYQERLVQYMATLARQPPTASLAAVTLRQEAASANFTSIFTPVQAIPVVQQQAALDSLGQAIGAAGQAAAMDLGASAIRVASQRWTAYRTTTPVPDVGSAATTTSWFSRLSSSRSAPVQYQEEHLETTTAGFSGRESARSAARDSTVAAQPPARMQTRSSTRLRESPEIGDPMSVVVGTGASDLPVAPVVRPERRTAARAPSEQQSSLPRDEGPGRSGLETQGSWFGSSRWVAGGSAADQSGAVQNLGAAVGSALWQYMNQRAGQGPLPSGHEPSVSRQDRRGNARQGRNEL